MKRDFFHFSVVFFTLVGCAPARQTSSETHFVTCETDVQCTHLGVGYACVGGQCASSADGSVVKNGTAEASPEASNPDGGPQVCGDNVCSAPETRTSCPGDCVYCGNQYCEPSEDRFSCPVDCGYCGNGSCETFEDASNCPNDCYCGDLHCDDGETTASCPIDCGRDR